MKALKDEIVVFDGDFARLKLIQAADASGAADVRIAYYGI